MNKSLATLIVLVICTAPSVVLAQSTTGGQDDNATKPKLSTQTIVQETISCLDCFDYEVVGICFWLTCTIWSCDVDTSIKVKHYIPDLVVSTYTSDSAWEDMRELNDEAPGGLANTESPFEKDTPLDFKSVDIVAHPTVMIYNELGDEELFCKSQQETPLMPVYVSSWDMFWNHTWLERGLQIWGLEMEMIKATSSGGSGVVGFVLSPYWAPVYPRCGFGANPVDPINSAVSAHRAADIATRENEPHVYLEIDGDCDEEDHKCWNPEPVEANNDNNKFQMIYPKVETTAKPFGGSATWANGKHILHEAYTWSLWRKYKCCERNGMIFLFDIDWEGQQQ